MGDLFGILATLLLVGANAFFVASEFSLISARRDRLEALAEQGRSSAVTVMRAGEQLPLMRGVFMESIDIAADQAVDTERRQLRPEIGLGFSHQGGDSRIHIGDVKVVIGDHHVRAFRAERLRHAEPE